ncbi:MAG: hypothetical protein SF123_14775 [Chloroflexota bacterium]|nr:hypothetical protein [Chloroflexota bacterium]
MSTYFSQDLGEDPQTRLAARDEFLDIAQDEQIAEGDISVSETESGHHPLPELDDRETDDIFGEDSMTVLDEDDPELGFAYTQNDHYLDDEDEAMEDADGYDDELYT